MQSRAVEEGKGQRARQGKAKQDKAEQSKQRWVRVIGKMLNASLYVYGYGSDICYSSSFLVPGSCSGRAIPSPPFPSPPIPSTQARPLLYSTEQLVKALHCTATCLSRSSRWDRMPLLCPSTPFPTLRRPILRAIAQITHIA